MRSGMRRALVGAAIGAVLGVAAAVAVAQFTDKRSGQPSGVAADKPALTVQQGATLALQIVNILRQLLSLA